MKKSLTQKEIELTKVMDYWKEQERKAKAELE